MTQDLIIGQLALLKCLSRRVGPLCLQGHELNPVEATQLSLEVGGTGMSANRFDIALGNLSVRALGLDAVIVRSASESLEGITTIDRALEQVDGLMAQFAASENRLRVSESQAIDTECQSKSRPTKLLWMLMLLKLQLTSREQRFRKKG